MAYAGIQMFMQKLNQLINCNDNPLINHPEIIRERPQFQLLYDELASMIQALFIDQHQEVEKVNDLKKRFTDAAEEAQYIVDLFLSCVLVKSPLKKNDVSRSFKYVANLFLSCIHIRNNGHSPTSDDINPSLNLDGVWRSFDLVKVELKSMSILSTKMDSSRRTPSQYAAAPVSFTRNPQGSKNLIDEMVVGLDRDFELIRDKILEDRKKVDVVSIVGMGGIGKTTLATKVFNDAYIKHHFHVCVWVTVSQTYDKRDVLIQILESIRVQLDLQKDNIESRLRELVHKHLMGKRYLIVIDDIWHTETWDDLKVFFPHDNNGSRILLTSRLTEVAKHANSNGLIHRLGYLNSERSLELLRKKVFHGNECPEWSIKPGMQIVENCHGLPLAVLVIAGVLAKEAWCKRFWEEIAERTGSYIVGDQNGCMETLALSYNHLPLHLKECFLYLGGFPEDHKFKVKSLISLWVAEGFIQQAENGSLEDIAEGYLMDLIDRNLVIVVDRMSNGAMKACIVHDLVRELCLRKAKEERFFLQAERLTLSSHNSNVTTPPYKPVRMFVLKDINILGFRDPSAQNLRSKLCFGGFTSVPDEYFHSFVLLRVLDLQKCVLNDFPKGMELLVHLRYLAISTSAGDFPSSICRLWNLQTLIYNRGYGDAVTLPSNISDLVNLRHLWSSRWKAFYLPFIEKPMNLQTIANVELGDGVHCFQKCFPYIQELKCTASEKEYEYDFKTLTCLEKLKLIGFFRRTNHNIFPATLKTLTLVECFLPWSDMSIIQLLPNLQVLKLKEDAFEGSCWNTDGHEFPQLKFLRLEKLNVKQWEAYSTSFPCLRQLEIIFCKYLEEIPLEIGEIPTLELIKIKYCSYSVGESVRKIQEEQHDFGNYDLKIDISYEFDF